TRQVTGPDGSLVQGFYGLLGDRITGVVEVAAASGLTLLPEAKRNPLLTTSLGTGQLIKAALDQGVSKLIIGLGGSATNDGGMGLLTELGVKFLTKDGEILPGRGIDLLRVAKIDIRELDSRLADMEILMACDVTNPFYGPEGAALIYAPQKGADVSKAKKLDKGLANLAGVFQRQFKVDVQKVPGSGAAGGIGGGLAAVLGAKFRPGIDLVLQSAGFFDKLPELDLILTGEGRTDRQTAFGKAAVGIAKHALNFDIPVVCISGSLGEGYQQVLDQGISAVFSVLPQPMSLELAMLGAARHIQATAEMVVRLYYSKG
ncbi:MAG: glycerate kinase family protein, partial [Carboxydocellales bacterium]